MENEEGKSLFKVQYRRYTTFQSEKDEDIQRGKKFVDNFNQYDKFDKDDIEKSIYTTRTCKVTIVGDLQSNITQNYTINKIYSSSIDDENFNNCFLLDNILDMYETKFYIKLDGGGDYQIKIFKYFGDINFTESKEVKDFINLFGKAIVYDENKTIIYDGDKYHYRLKEEWTNKPLKNIYYNDINPCKLVFSKIFNIDCSDNKINYFVIYNNGNCIQIIFEVGNNKFFIKRITS